MFPDVSASPPIPPTPPPSLVPPAPPGLPARRPVLDARPRAAFVAGHAPGAAHLPAAEWDARAAELPPRSLAFDLVADDPAEAGRLAAELVRRGFAHATPAPPEVAADHAETGPARGGLWRPAPWLEEMADRLPAGGRVLDVACGTGRGAVWLARRGLRAVGFDVLPDAIERARRLARAARDYAPAGAPGASGTPGAPGTPGSSAFLVADATAPLPFRDGSFDVVMGFRFLERAIFPTLAALLRPGGLLLWETFTLEQRRFGPPHRAAWLLDAGELPRLCEAAGLVVVESREGIVGPDGPAVAAVLARRPVLA
jgi:SAM-dependent methyltransferase